MNTSKIITYDLVSPGRDYESLIKEIKNYQSWDQITESTWFISTPDSCSAVMDNLSKHLDSNDRIFVATLSKNAVWKNINWNNEFLVKKHLTISY
ncbi:CRISPR-associated protein Cas2 [Bacillus sp. FDAARGOS_1420]|uniref:CRISPR-associated protein Cas2 n=1 Tax=unclassified Bacillus (in: firmicutes) TaxID=185979 RepID=UPI001C5BB0D4|nr:CRISPR-associated protein Cas2 [Bacillus sp. FDAARGOS_1420]MBW3490605.1 CRISPR-associated protein Cas2 [Bacillus sp. FDAARGOS_1420]